MRLLPLLIAFALSAAPAFADETPVRISIARQQFQTVVSSDGGLAVRRPDAASGSPYVAPAITTVLDIRPAAGGLLLAGAITAGDTLALTPVAGFPISVDGRLYRGSVIVQSNGNGTLDVINVVDLEEYLYGVVGSEMEPHWPHAALSAQAIVARTYAVAHLGTREWLGYDLLAGEQDQAYTGMQAEAPEVVAAVNATRGTVLVYGANLVHAYYSDCDGGYTAGGDALADPQPYLQSSPDRFCTLSPNERWSADVPLDDFSNAFRSQYGDIGAITLIVPGAADASGRLQTVSIRGTIESRSISGPAFRALAGNHLVRSTRIDSIDVAGSTIRVSGFGFGHGVGMSQWGARGMADAGKSAREILRYYYRGAEFAQIADALRHSSGAPLR
jgi:stage II sporulation protein D